MLRLIQLEWMKIKSNRTFFVIFIIYLVALPTFYSIGKSMDLPKEFEVNSFYSFPFIWSYLGYLGSWLTYFCFGFLGVMLITFEYRNKTMRQNIMSGMSRNEFLSGKLLLAFCISMLATLYYVFISMLYGFTHTDYIITSKIFQEGQLIFSYFLQCFGYMSFAILLGLLIRRMGIAVFLFLTYGLFIEKGFRSILHFYFLENQASSLYYPMNSLGDLVPFPMHHAVANGIRMMSEDKFGDFFLNYPQAVLMSLFWVGLFIGLSFLVINKRDL